MLKRNLLVNVINRAEIRFDLKLPKYGCNNSGKD